MSQGPVKKPKRTRISLASRAGDKSTPLGVIGSLALHGLVIAGMMFTFAHRLDIIDQSSPVVPVDLVTLSTKTNVMPSIRAVPKVTQVSPPQTPVETHEPVVPKEVPEPVPPPDQAPSEPVTKAPPPPATPRIRPQEQKPKSEKKAFDVDKVLALLNKVAPSASPSNARVANRDVQGIGSESAMTADLQSMLISEIKPCWSPPVGAPHPEELIVNFDVTFNPDGTVARPPQLVDQSTMSGSPYFRAAAEAARRALYTCQPFKLPADQYEQWREIAITFDPRQMMGD
jgi:outer membrane biosynthesis protein TonB